MTQQLIHEPTERELALEALTETPAERLERETAFAAYTIHFSYAPPQEPDSNATDWPLSVDFPGIQIDLGIPCSRRLVSETIDPAWYGEDEGDVVMSEGLHAKWGWTSVQCVDIDGFELPAGYRYRSEVVRASTIEETHYLAHARVLELSKQLDAILQPRLERLRARARVAELWAKTSSTTGLIVAPHSTTPVKVR